MNNSISKNMTEKILHELQILEQEHQVKILYACESGSRGWGFESQNSDYDVRFFYIHKPEWYLSIRRGRDVIERPITDELDISGWDLQKTLFLLMRSNPPLLEKLQSPIVYLNRYNAADQLRNLMKEYFSPVASMYHYRNMAVNNFKRFLQGDKIILKKYFYALRPVLACKWLGQEQNPVPMEFEKLVQKTIDNKFLLSAIEDLLKQKKAGLELNEIPKIPLIHEFLENELKHLETMRLDKEKNRKSIELLDRFFMNMLESVWA